MNCDKLIGTTKERRSINVTIYRSMPQIPLREALQTLYEPSVSVTPLKKCGERALCLSCFQLVGAFTRHKQNYEKALKQFENVKSQSVYPSGKRNTCKLNAILVTGEYSQVKRNATPIKKSHANGCFVQPQQKVQQQEGSKN